MFWRWINGNNVFNTISLPDFTLSKIRKKRTMPFTININVGPDLSSSSVAVTGSDTHPITADEVTSFGITDSAIKAAVNSYFGNTPDDVYFGDPTAWGNLFAEYGWPPTSTSVSVQSATITAFNSVPEVVASKDYENNTGGPITCVADVTDSITNTTETNWSDSSQISIGQTLSYEVFGVGGETNFSYTQTWEQGGSESNTVTIGTSSGVSFELPAGETATVDLTANRGVMTVTIVYQQVLSGSLLANYGDRYQGHHFWGLDIQAVMQAGKIANMVTITQNIIVDLVSNTQIVVNETSSTKRRLLSFPLSARPSLAELV